MSGRRIYRTDRPSLVGAPVLPMTDETREYWRLLRLAREKKESAQ